MPVVTAYRRARLVAGPRGYHVEWGEWSFEPPGAPAPVVAPPLSRLVTRRVCAADGEWRDAGRLAVPWDAWGLDPETVHWLAARGERGFRLATEEDMGKRRADGGPGLFPEEAPEPTASAYPRAAAPAVRTVDPGPLCGTTAPDRERLRSEVAELAAEVIGPLAEAARRALEELRAAIDGGEPERVVTARAILECALEDAGGGGRAA